MHVEQVAVVRLLVGRCESAEDYHVIIRYLEQPASLETYPIGVLLDLQVQCLPVIALLEVEFFDEVSALTAIEARHHVQRLVVEG